MVVCGKMNNLTIDAPLNKGESPMNEGDKQVRHQEKQKSCNVLCIV